MPYLPTSQSWLAQSSMLLQARPSTTRITTKYSVSTTSSRKPGKKGASNATATESSTAQAPKAILSLKAFDPVSGVCLKYQTDKAAEVGRLVASLARLGRVMSGQANSEEMDVDVVVDTAPVEGKPSGASTPIPPEDSKPSKGEGKGKKRKGRK